VLEPEARLIVLLIATPFMIAGLALLGFALANGYHYMMTALGWGLYNFGVMLVTVGINAYLLDSYPDASGEIGAWVNLSRTMSGFLVSFFMVPWALAQGTVRMFATMAAVVFAAALVVVALMVWGKRLRAWSGPLDFKTS